MPDPLANARAGMPINHDFAIIDTSDGPMVMYCAYPDGPGPFPAAIVISGQPGPSSPEILGAEILANRGYVGCAIDLMHRGPAIHSNEDQQARRRNLTDDKTITDMHAGLDYLKSLPFVQADSLGIVGFCMGGRVAYMMAGLRNDLGAIASLYGSGIYVGYGGPAPIERTADINCPVLILNGDKDRVITPDECHKIAGELQRHGKTVEVHIYPDTGHAFMATRGSKEVSDDAWFRTLAWFDRYLAKKPALAEVAS
ncbi:MAG TPA: dienelactone hydrolase family protein [Chloroflexota bacterium]|nr:dienelactone hydrolase family protein [Chloroflexota bacterium]